MILTDLLALPALLWLSLWVAGADAEGVALGLAAVAGLVALLAFGWLGLYRTIVRVMDFGLVMAAVRTLLPCAVFVSAVLAFSIDAVVAVRVGIAFLALGLVYVMGSRFAAGILAGVARPRGQRVVVYGEAYEAARLAALMRGHGSIAPVALVDDNPDLVGHSIDGFEVHRSSDLPRLIDTLGVSRVLLTISPGRERRRVMERLARLPVRVQTIPDVSKLIAGQVGLTEVSDVDVVDLLDRDPVPPLQDLLETCIRDKNVLVTGAGGSIGSALCRQILTQKPRRLILLDLSEAALYNIDREMRAVVAREGLPDDLVVPLIGSVLNRARVRDVLESYRVDTVYHAAAYKHVPLVEYNMIEGVQNNVFGTLYTAEECLRAGVGNMVLVSTDKAVNPNSVMGATKRLAELVLQGLQQRGGGTKLSIVRFGNVLGASGSIVPLFLEQIRGGGPVTITHPEVTRYFMTIDEAVSLVIQAGSMAHGGDVFALDMGKPVRVKDLAEKIVALMGVTVRDDDNPGGDVEISYIGLRPAEKLYEELAIGRNVTGTRHPMILRAREEFIPWPELNGILERVGRAGAEFDCERMRQLLELVVDYEPIEDVEDLVWQESRRRAQAQGGASRSGSNVTELPRGAELRQGD